MKTLNKFLSVLFLIGWFFSLRAPVGQHPGVWMLQIVGPYQTSEQCNAVFKVYKEDVKDIPGVEFTKGCFENKNA